MSDCDVGVEGGDNAIGKGKSRSGREDEQSAQEARYLPSLHVSFTFHVFCHFTFLRGELAPAPNGGEIVPAGEIVRIVGLWQTPQETGHLFFAIGMSLGYWLYEYHPMWAFRMS